MRAATQTRRRHVRTVAVAVLAAALGAALLLGGAGAGITDNVYAVGFSTNSIYQVNLANGTATAIYTGYPIAPAAGNSAALAQRASDGMLFYIAGTAGNDAVYRWNPATPAVAPVLLGRTGAAIPYVPRLAFNATGTLYAISSVGTQLYTVNTTTGAATATGAPLSGTPTGGGDMAFNPANGTLYLVGGTTVYTVPLAGGTLTNLGNITGMTGTAVGLAFDPVGGAMLVANSDTPAKLYSVNLSGLAATAFSGTMTAGMGDLASVARREADLAVTKTDGSATATAGSAVSYTVTVSNSGPSNVTGATFTDTVPAALTGVTWACAITSGSGACGAASGSGNAIATTVSLNAGAVATYTVAGSLAAGASGTLANTAAAAVPAGGRRTRPRPTTRRRIPTRWCGRRIWRSRRRTGRRPRPPAARSRTRSR